MFIAVYVSFSPYPILQMQPADRQFIPMVPILVPMTAFGAVVNNPHTTNGCLYPPYLFY
jgi:hypothetical protein